MALTIAGTLAATVPAVSSAAHFPAPGTAHPLLEDAIAGKCVPPAANELLHSYRLQIANAPSTEEARALVLSQIGLARTALATAAWVMPFNASVREARAEIDGFERRVYAANTQTDVANEFSALLMPGGLDDGSELLLADADLNKSAVRVSGGDGGGCDYTTAEIIIIILGFFLFIIPGIIFLIIFC